jgi:hypothetical protein
MPRCPVAKLLFSLLLVSTLAGAAPRPVTFCDVCAGYMISKRGNDVLIRCPGAPIDQPWMTFPNCNNPTVERTPTQVKITCR